MIIRKNRIKILQKARDLFAHLFSRSLLLSLSLSGERKAIFAREKKKERNTRVSARTVWSFLSVSFRREREREF